MLSANALIAVYRRLIAVLSAFYHVLMVLYLRASKNASHGRLERRGRL